MDGKLAIETDDSEMDPFADADPEWLRAQILPALDEYDRDPSTGTPMEDVFRLLEAELRSRL